MRYVIGSQELEVAVDGSKKGRGETPHQVVSWNDCVKTCRAIDAVCQTVSPNPKTLVDGIARAGFWSALFQHLWPGIKLHLNESEDCCLSVLRSNFPKVKITSHDVCNWSPPKCDFAFLDFDDFTIRKLDRFRSALEGFSKVCDRLLFIDSACYGFKFGTLKHYGVEKEQDYYELLQGVLGFTGMRVVAVSKFSNAAAVLLQPGKKRSIKFLEPSNLSVYRGEKGFGVR
jgi:hypothetical protein